MVEGQMDHGIRLRRAAAQTFQIFQITALHLGASARQSVGASVGASKSQNLMTCANQLRDQSRTNEACRACNKYTHFFLLNRLWVRVADGTRN
jgi:hypothetical protein